MRLVSIASARARSALSVAAIRRWPAGERSASRERNERAGAVVDAKRRWRRSATSASRFSPTESSSALAWASVAGRGKGRGRQQGQGAVAAMPASASRRLSESIGQAGFSVRLGEGRARARPSGNCLRRRRCGRARRRRPGRRAPTIRCRRRGRGRHASRPAATTTTTLPSRRAAAVVEVGDRRCSRSARRRERRPPTRTARKARIAKRRAAAQTRARSGSVSRPVAIAAAPMKTRKKPGAMTSAISSTTPPISHSQAGSMASRSFVAVRNARGGFRPWRGRRVALRRRQSPPWRAHRSRRACRSAGSLRPGTGSSWHWASGRTRRSPRHISAR